MHEESSEKSRTLFHQWTRNALGIAVIIHVVGLLAAASIVAMRSVQKQEANFQAPPPQTPRLDPRKLEMKVRVQDLQKRSARPKLQPRLVSTAMSDVVLPEIKKKPKKVQNKPKLKYSVTATSGFGDGIGGGDGFGGGGGGGIGTPLPKLIEDRCSYEARMRRLRAGGGDESSEIAVMKALRHLKSTQNPDGSWGEEHKAAMTGYVLLAFLGHCETPESIEFGQTVENAINFLLKVSDDKGGWLYTTAHKHGKSYAHGVATYALAEAYSMTQDKELRSPLRKAVKIIADGQTQIGGWVYGYETSSNDNDMSLFSWQVQALKAADVAGANVGSGRKAIRNAVELLQENQNSDGGYSYRTKGKANSSNILTGAGVYCLQINGASASPQVTNGLRYMAGIDGGYNGASIYQWYYATLAHFQAGGATWKSWMDKYYRSLVDAQRPDGSWNPSRGGAGQFNHHGGGDDKDADAYRTAVNTLMLEVFYRYLKV